MKRVIIVGSGVNGLCAGIALARSGVRVTVFEGSDTPGGCVRTEALTLPGFVHDAGAAVFPLGIASPFLRSLPLMEHGLEWIEPDVPMAHPLGDADALGLLHDLRETEALLGADGRAWMSLMKPLVEAWPALVGDALGPILRLPAHPLLTARFGLNALLPSTRLAARFRDPRVRTMIAGLAGHGNVPLHFAATAAPTMLLAAAAHATGWPIVRGGAASLIAALISILQAYGGEVQTGRRIESLSEVRGADAVMLDLSPAQMQQLAGDALPAKTQRRYRRFRRSSGVCKVDWALSAPIPWTAKLCRRAGTVHLGASFEEIVASEKDAWNDRSNLRPYVLLSQPSLFDPTRAPSGRHTAWAYCHVPRCSPEDFTDRIEEQVERFAPGFRATILARNTRTAPQMQEWNPNLICGDITGGAMTLGQMIRRPTVPPYFTSMKGVFLCSSSTPPGGGVHGMCGYFAAVAAAAHMGLKLPKLS